MQTIQWCPFSEKHIQYIRNAIECKMSVAEGAIRAGKTIDNCIIACAELETTPDKIHLATGSTIANAKMNIGDCNGFGLEHLFKGRCRWGKYKDNEALFIKTQTGDKIVVFAGGGKADSYKKILGNSYGLWIATEINEHYDCDDSKTSFIKVALGRQLASKHPKILWDLNPSNPNHRIYTDYIDLYRNNGIVGGYNYQHFTYKDNLSLDAEQIASVESMYNPDTVWYKRDILGQRCVAEGNIYQEFANNPSKFFISKKELLHKNITHINIGVDFGGNKSSNAFVCTGFTAGLREVIILRAERHDGKMTPDKLENLFAEFLKKCYDDYSMGGNVYCDSAEQTLISGFKAKVYSERLRFNIYDAKKNPINERIKIVLKLMACDRFKVVEEDCATVIEALSQAVYNNKIGHEDERLDNGTTHIDDLDATEYSIEPHLNDLKNIL